MKIDTNGNPYNSVIEAIVKRTESFTDTYVVKLRTTVLGENIVLMIPNGYGWYEFDTDWYEGGEIELLGYISLQDIAIPQIT